MLVDCSSVFFDSLETVNTEHSEGKDNDKRTHHESTHTHTHTHTQRVFFISLAKGEDLNQLELTRALDPKS